MTERFNDGVIDLSQFKKAKEEEAVHTAPFFSDSAKIEFEDEQGNPVFYMLMMNFVYKDRQIVVVEGLEGGEVPNGQIGIAEAVIENNQFYGMKGIESQEEFEEITEIITHYLADEGEEESDDEPND